ncbi:MAG: hypothetical protein KF720_22010 [Rubrivivax sp.]|nr:hypothetical protein [Rubrivivax sp.]
MGLSPARLERAAARAVHDVLHCAELAEHRTQTDARVDLLSQQTQTKTAPPVYLPDLRRPDPALQQA